MTATLTQACTDAVADTRPVALLLYLRISNDPEGLANGVKRQGDDLNRLIVQRTPDAVVLGTFCDNDLSASPLATKERPDYDRMIVAAREAAMSGQYREVQIAAYSDSRLTRDPSENETLIRLAVGHGVRFRYIKSPEYDLNTADGREAARNAGVRNAGYSERIGELVTAQKVQAVQVGVWRGSRAPFGYRLVHDVDETGKRVRHPGQLENEGYLVQDPTEAAAITDAVRTLLVPSKVTASSIARQWDTSGVRPRTARQWSVATVIKILTRATIAGLIEVDRALFEAQWEGIITRDELLAVRARLRTGKKYARTSREWLGSGGTYRCACGTAMRCDGKYRCNDRAHVVIVAAPVDSYVRGVVCSILKRHGAALLAKSNAAEVARLADEAITLRAEIDALAAEYAQAPRRSPRAFMAATADLEDQLSRLEDARVALVDPTSALKGVADTEDPVRVFLDLPLERQRAIVAALVTVTIHPGRRGGKRTASTQRQWEVDMVRARVRMTGRIVEVPAV